MNWETEGHKKRERAGYNFVTLSWEEMNNVYDSGSVGICVGSGMVFSQWSADVGVAEQV